VAVLVLVPLAAAAPAPPPEVLAEAAKMDHRPFERDTNATRAAMASFAASLSGVRIRECVTALTTEGADQYRLMGTPTHDQFVQAHAQVFGQLGLPTALQTFARGGPGEAGVTVPTGGTNILGVLPGKDASRWVVIGAHYDTRELTAGGGAYDNASGLCTVLEVARQAKAAADAGQAFQASWVFAWYDGEEWGLYGSMAFANDTSVAAHLLGLAEGTHPRILVSQSFDMPGLNWPAMDLWAQYGNATDMDKTAVLNLRTAPIHRDQDWACWSYGCYQDLKVRPDFESVWRNDTDYQFLVREVAYDLLHLPPRYVWVYDDAYGRSDHIPLIAHGAAGMRIQGVHDAEYPHYHEPTDTVPALVALAGSESALDAGYTTEVQVGGTVADYVALTGGVGTYGTAFDPSVAQPAAGTTVAPTNPTPALATPVAAFVLVLAALGETLRRRA